MKSFKETLTKLKNKTEDYLSQGKEVYFSTCNLSINGWSVNEHKAVELLAKDYRKKGFPVDRSVRHGVTDTVIFPKIDSLES